MDEIEKNEIEECIKNFKDTERDLKKINESSGIT